MQTVIVRLSAPSGDGKLHGLVEVVGARTSEPFTDDDELLTLLRDAQWLTTPHSESGSP